jgi:hypothetical protein|tara:strand:- start:1198 stop:1764 length:567 start_codon:yes stop_codon:yes gene_type:complete
MIENRLKELEAEANGILKGCGLEWKEEFLSTQDYSPDFNHGDEREEINFNIVVGQMLSLYDIKSKSFRERFNGITDDIIAKYNDLKKDGVDFVAKALTEYHPLHQEEIKKIIASKDLRDISKYSLEELLPIVYYNNRDGEETAAHALSVTEKQGILVFNSDDFTKVFYIGFGDINSLCSKIDLIECMV